MQYKPWIIHTNVDWKRCIIALRLRVRSTLTHFTVVRGCIYGDGTGGQRKARRKAAVKLLKNNAKRLLLQPEPVGIF